MNYLIRFDPKSAKNVLTEQPYIVYIVVKNIIEVHFNYIVGRFIDHFCDLGLDNT